MDRYSTPVDDCYEKKDCKTKYDDCDESSSDDCQISSEEECKKEVKCKPKKKKQHCKPKKKQHCDDGCGDNRKHFDVYSKIGSNISNISKSKSKVSNVFDELQIAFDKLGISKKMGFDRKYQPLVGNKGHVKLKFNIEFNGTPREFMTGKKGTWEVKTDLLKYHAGHILAAGKFKEYKMSDATGLHKEYMDQLNSINVTVNKGTYKSGKSDLHFSTCCDITGVATNSLTDSVCKGLYVHGNTPVTFYNEPINENLNTVELDTRVNLYGSLTEKNISSMVGKDKGDDYTRMKVDSDLYKNFFVKRVGNYKLSKKVFNEKNINDEGKFKLKTSIADQVIADAIKERDTLPMYKTIKAVLSPANGKSWKEQFGNLDIKGNGMMSGKNKIFKSNYDLEVEHNVTFAVELDLGMYV